MYTPYFFDILCTLFTLSTQYDFYQKFCKEVARHVNNVQYIAYIRQEAYLPKAVINILYLRDPPPENETWTNKVCRPGNSTYTISNANCYQGICQCNPGYFSSNAKDFCHHCPEPHVWNSVEEICENRTNEDESNNDPERDCEPFIFSCTNNELEVFEIMFIKVLNVTELKI